MQIRPNAAKIKRWREERHWSQEHMADLAGIGTRTIQRIENGEAASKDSLMALAAAFNVDVAALTFDTEAQAKGDKAEAARKSLESLKLSFYIHMASFTFGLIVFLAVSISDDREGLIMLVPAAWWAVGVAAHALTVIIVTLVNQAEYGEAGI